MLGGSYYCTAVNRFIKTSLVVRRTGAIRAEYDTVVELSGNTTFEANRVEQWGGEAGSG